MKFDIKMILTNLSDVSAWPIDPPVSMDGPKASTTPPFWSIRTLNRETNIILLDVICITNKFHKWKY